MLASPVIAPAYAEPFVWVLALVAIWAEVRAVMWLLRRAGNDVPGLLAPLFGANLTTWFVFLIAVDRADRWRLPMGWSIGVLGAFVVLVEAVLLHGAMRGRLFTCHLPVQPIGWRRALFVAAVGNLVSAGLCFALAGAIASFLN
jgi:hypothetical protein